MYLRWMSVTDLANQDQALEADHCGLNGGSLLFASTGGHERGGLQVQSCMRPPLSWNTRIPGGPVCRSRCWQSVCLAGVHVEAGVRPPPT